MTSASDASDAAPDAAGSEMGEAATNVERPAKHACPRCHSGFLVFNATLGGDNGVCINCGFRGPVSDESPLLSHSRPRLPRADGSR
jgi:hypothetical protein